MSGDRRALPTAVLAFALLAGCGSEHRPTTEPLRPDGLLAAPAVAVTPQEVGRTFALGGRHTDVQREDLLNHLIGRAVEWELRVYDIEFEDGVYHVISQPLSEDPAGGGFGVLRARAVVSPINESDHATLRSVQTDDLIRVRGQVQSIEMRLLLLLEPAVLVPGRPQ